MPTIPETRAGKGALGRVTRAFVGQRRGLLRCPEAPRLDGTTSLVTGPTGGIGLETARGLLDRGAEVVLAARNRKKAARVRETLGDDGERLDRIRVVTPDLADLETVAGAVGELREQLGTRRLDLLVENAGVWPQGYAETPQGFESAFGTNVLGHFAFRAALMEAGLLAPTARVVVLTGDAYILQSDCTSDYRYSGRLGAMKAYCRSKLGNLWIGRELQRRHPELAVYVVHPGAIASGLSGASGIGAWIQDKILIGPESGAQTSLLCATQEGLEPGGYYHNVLGRVQLAAEDPGMNGVRARALWEECERLAADAWPNAASTR